MALDQLIRDGLLGELSLGSTIIEGSAVIMNLCSIQQKRWSNLPLLRMLLNKIQTDSKCNTFFEIIECLLFH